MTRSSCVVVLCAAALAASLGPAVCAQPSQASSAPGPVVKAAAEEVMLDVVVRDKKGREVKNLKSDDFQVFDNGEPKQIKSFRLIEGKETIGAGGAQRQLDPLRQIRLVTMIFQCRSTEARRLARDAASDLLKQKLPSNVYMAVMAIDHKLEVLQQYTNDPGLLRKAIDEATKSQVTDFSADTERVRKELEQAVRSNPGGPSAQGLTNFPSTPGTAASPSSDTDAWAKVVMAQMLLQALQTERSNAMMESGRAEIFALLDAAKEQNRVPGRKTVLYLSEGFTIPLGMEAAFNDLISVANRANVSFCIVDAHGLGILSTNQEGIDQLRGAAQSSLDQRSNMGDRPVERDEAQLIDTTIQSTRANYQMTLANLAESTGGFLVANTNDLRSPIRRLAEDIQTYYEISYAPDIRSYDGSFHKIAVKMASGDLRVQSRSGYSALPPSGGSAGPELQPYEALLLAALKSPELSKSFDYEAAALHFRGPRNESVCDVVLDVPLAHVTFQKGNASGQYKGRLSYVVLLKDVQGKVVKKLQNDVPLMEPAARLESLKATHFIYTVHFDLPPGRYALETAVSDGEGHRISARKSSVTMPESSGLAISSASIIRSTKEREGSTDDGDPLLLGTKVISPTLNAVIDKAGTRTLPFYFVIYTNKSVAAAPQLTMEFSRNGKILGAGLPPLGSPDRDGRIQYVAMTPLDRFEPGDLTVRFIVKQGSETAVESTTFTLQ